MQEDKTQTASEKRVRLLSHLHREKCQETHLAKNQITI